MESTPQIGSAALARGPRFTWDDFVALGDEYRRELIDGELIEIDAPTKLHTIVVGQILFHLMLWVRAQGAGLVIGSGYKIRISDTRGVMPDVQYFGPANPAAKSFADEDDARPDLAVEVISPTSREYDQATKLEWYASIGVPEYWLVDPEAHTLQRMRLTDGRYTVTDALRGDATFTPESFPRLAIPLAQLWSIPTTAPRTA